jgi:hypothetical protein
MAKKYLVGRKQLKHTFEGVLNSLTSSDMGDEHGAISAVLRTA